MTPSTHARLSDAEVMGTSSFIDRPVVALIDASGGSSSPQIIAMMEFALAFSGKAGGVMLFHDTELRGTPLALDAVTVASLSCGSLVVPGGGGSLFARPVAQALDVALSMGPSRLLILNDFMISPQDTNDAVKLARAHLDQGIEATFCGCCDVSGAATTDLEIVRIRSQFGVRALDGAHVFGFHAREEASGLDAHIPNSVVARPRIPAL